MTDKRSRWWVWVVAAFAVIVGLAALGMWAMRPDAVSTGTFDAKMTSGTFAGIPVKATAGPIAPTVDVSTRSADYDNVPSCTAYWESAARNATRAAELTPNATDQALVNRINVQLWNSPDAARSASAGWATCLTDYASAHPAGYPMQALDSGTTDDVVWTYYANLSSATGRQSLELRSANVIASFEVPDGPEVGWREGLIEAFAADVEAMAS